MSQEWSRLRPPPEIFESCLPENESRDFATRSTLDHGLSRFETPDSQ